MRIDNENDIIQLVKGDPWMMNVLETAKSLQLPDWWVCAGFVRSKIWDVLHGFEDRTSLSDIDVIYYDTNNLHEAEEKRLEHLLQRLNPTLPWSVKNQARMHVVNHLPPYSSSVDAISKFPETATALGLTLDENNTLCLTAPHGLQDVVSMTVRPTPHFLENRALFPIYEERLIKKNWSKVWPQLQIYSNEAY